MGVRTEIGTGYVQTLTLGTSYELTLGFRGTTISLAEMTTGLKTAEGLAPQGGGAEHVGAPQGSRTPDHAAIHREGA